MTIFETYLPKTLSDYFIKNKKHFSDFRKINNLLKTSCGINDFFKTQEDATILLQTITENQSIVAEPDRREYGDYQTNESLAQQNLKFLPII